MPLTKINKIILVMAVFSAMFLVTRIPFLGYDEINPDGVSWHLRSELFVAGLKSGDFLKTYQHYHPGVTLMWVMGTPIEIARQINPEFRVYNQDNFLQLHRIAKYALVSVQLVLSIWLIIALKEVLGLRKSLLAVSIFSFEPFFLGNSRVLHMDVLLTLLITLSLTYSYKYLTRRSISYIILSGIFAGLAFLTKSVGILTAVMAASLPAIAIPLRRRSLPAQAGNPTVAEHPTSVTKASIISLSALLLSTAATIFIFFPALWVNPKFVLSDIYNEGFRVGALSGHDQVVMGKTVDIAGPAFYPLVLALKTSPLIWLGIAFFIFQFVKHQRKYQDSNIKFILYLSIFYIVYFLGISLASKKMDRYIVPLFPWLGIISAAGIIQTFVNVQSRYGRPLLGLLIFLVTGIGIFYPLAALYPYYFTYTNPLFGSAGQANKIIGQKPFGMGIPELKKYLARKYGKDVTLGFIDEKPMSMLYKNSKLSDIREAGTSRYNLIILGPNEEMPKNILNGKSKFIQDDAVYINGLEFWRIYKKVI